MKTIDLREGANNSLLELSKGDILIMQNGDKYVLLSNVIHEHFEHVGFQPNDYTYYEARSYEHEWEEFYGFYYVFIENNTVSLIDGVCMYNEMTGAI